jgi:probable addiction module antidote protein
MTTEIRLHKKKIFNKQSIIGKIIRGGIMKKINVKKTHDMTADYGAWLQEHLQDKKAARDHLQVALDIYQEDQNNEALLLALKDVAQAQGGIGWLAQETNLNREHLYYLLSGKGNPRLDTVSLILKALGLHLKLSFA